MHTSSNHETKPFSRRAFLAGAVATTMGAAAGFAQRQKSDKKALIAITLDLEMSRHYPRRGMMEWDYQKGNLDEATKQYTVQATKLVKERGGVIHSFCVGRVLEQANIEWLQQISEDGHPIGNHTYDHVNVLAMTPEKTQFRFQRSPWLVKGKTAAEVIRHNIQITTTAMQQRAGITPAGFRTPGGFYKGLSERPDVQNMLLDLGFKWISSKYPPHKRGEPNQEPTADVYQSIVKAQAAAQPFVYPSGLIEIPMSPISDVTAFRSTFWKREYFLKAIRQSVEWAIETGGVYDFLCHPSCMVVEDPKFETFKMICDLVEQSNGRSKIVGLDTIASHVKK